MKYSEPHRVARPSGKLWLLLTTFLAIACSKDDESILFRTNEKAAGDLVSVAKGDTVVGFSRGTLRVTEKTGDFQISKYPVTKKQYQSCQDAGVCTAPMVDECSDVELARTAGAGSDDTVAVCVGRANAASFCKWVGGRLPTLAEWLRAARGADVQPYSWGKTRPNCALHPRSLLTGIVSGTSESTEGCSGSLAESLVTKTHPDGAAKDSGMQDVLLAPAELIDGRAGAALAPCGQGQNCLVYGGGAGAIDSVQPYTIANYRSKDEVTYVPMAYGFRCVVER